MVIARRMGRLLGLPVVVLALAFTGSIAYAIPAELFFSEYVEGSSSNKALEIYNGTGTAIDLAAEGYSVQIFYNGNTTPNTTIYLQGTVSNSGVFVLRNSSFDVSLLTHLGPEQPIQLNASLLFNGNDAIALKKGTEFLDVFGQIGYDPDPDGVPPVQGWGVVPFSTTDATLRRKIGIFAGDVDGTDAFNPSVEWDIYAINTTSGLGTHSPVPIPSSIYLLGSGLVGLVGIGRRRMKERPRV